MGRNDSGKVLKIVGIAAIAAAAGAVTALMLAPKSGRELRNDIYNRGREKKERLKSKYAASKFESIEDLDDDYDLED